MVATRWRHEGELYTAVALLRSRGLHHDDTQTEQENRRCVAGPRGCLRRLRRQPRRVRLSRDAQGRAQLDRGISSAWRGEARCEEAHYAWPSLRV